MSSGTLSLRSAVLLIVNIILGTGIFINTAMLIQNTGFLGGFLYPIAGLFFLPIVLGMARLVGLFAQGTFYTFGKTFSDGWAIGTSLFYFFSKLASATLSITVFSRFIQCTVPSLVNTSIIAIASIIITLFTLLNLLNVRLGSLIQYGFVIMKMTPLLTVIICGLYHYDILLAVHPAMLWQGIPTGLPLLFFCFLGFESACSLTPIIENPQKNAPRAIIIAFSIVLIITFLFQTIMYCAVKPVFFNGMNYTAVFPLFLSQVLPSLMGVLTPLFSLFMGCSALGGAYGILYSNMWNLYIVGKNHTFAGSSYIAHKTSYGIPLYAVFAEGFLCLVYLYATQASQLPLQLIATIGSLIVYAICMYVLYVKEHSQLSKIALSSSMLLIVASVYRFVMI